MPPQSKEIRLSIGFGANWRRISDSIPRTDYESPQDGKPGTKSSASQIFMRKHAWFMGIFVLIAAARVAILFASQTHVHSDEAIIGLMGKHILEGRYFPFYMYGQPYNAGAAWEAYLAAIAFALFGVSVVSLKSCIVVLSLLCLLLFYRMCPALYYGRTAPLAAILFL